jgi:hypothetical protein
LEHVLKQGNAPADQRRETPRRGGQIFKVAIPSKGHEDVRQQPQANRLR